MIIYHNDLDGQCAAAIALRAEKVEELQDGLPVTEHKLVPITYGDPFPDMSTVPKNGRIIVLDWSPSLNDAYQLRVVALSQHITVVWIDHHPTAMEKFPLDTTIGKWLSEANEERDTTKSAALLTWMYYHGDNAKPPVAVRLVDDWDMWTHTTNPNGELTRQFVAGMKLQNTLPDSETWSTLFDKELNDPNYGKPFYLDVVQNGITVLEHEQWLFNRILEEHSHIVEYEGFKNCLAINTPHVLVSGISEHIREYHPVVICYFKDRRSGWELSLRSKTVNVGKIAASHGGGGHSGAAGYRCEELPFKV